MTQSRFVREQLASHHDYSRTYIWHCGDNHVVASFSLSAYAITLDELSKKQARGEQKVIPALLLGKFALDTPLQGKGLSGLLIADAIFEANKRSHRQYGILMMLTCGLTCPSKQHIVAKCLT